MIENLSASQKNRKYNKNNRKYKNNTVTKN